MLEQTTERALFAKLTELGKLEWKRTWARMKAEDPIKFLQEGGVPTGIGNALFENVKNALPNYISPTKQAEIKDAHPRPLYTSFVLLDPTTFGKVLKGGLEFTWPDVGIPEKELEFHDAGLNLLNELAVQKLTADVMNYNIKATSTDLGIPMSETKRETIRKFSHDVAFFRSKSLKMFRGEIANMIGGKNKLDEFEKLIAKSATEHDRSGIDNFLNTVGNNNLDSFAVSLGKHLKKEGGLFWTSQKAWKNVWTATRHIGGITYIQYPGVINLNLSSHVSLPQVGIHETLHYLTHDETNFGLKRIKYKQ